MNWMSLKSGTDVRGIALETEKGAVTLTDEVVCAITNGFLLWLARKTGKRVADLTLAVGHDSRISADRISDCVIQTAVSAGCKILDCGLSSTPSMFMITVDRSVDGTIQITASHHPYHLNGLKFFTRDGGLQGEDITQILSYCENDQIPPKIEGGQAVPTDYMTHYAKNLREMIAVGVGKTVEDRPLTGFHIVVDAGNGAGGFYAVNVLEPLGADISGSVYLEPDGMFPNHIPNPEDKVAMASIREAVLNNKADFGVIFDTDVDRAGCVDHEGNEINRNRLVALAASLALEGQEKGIIVTDSVTSDGLKTFIESNLKGQHYRYKRGYRNVINKAMELCDQGKNAPLAIETSGHAAFRENYFLDDGAYLITRIIIRLVQLKQEGKNLSDFLQLLEEPAQAEELRFSITREDFQSYGNQVLEQLEQFALANQGFTLADDNREGIRFSADERHGDGWLLLRLSVHDPVMPLNVESRKIDGCREILKAVYPLLKQQEYLDISSLDRYLEQ